jgi:hypothetical protein
MSTQKEKQDQEKEAQAVVNPDVTVVKIASAPKLSPRGEGGITYQVGRVDSDVYARIEKNDGGGSFSKEWVPLEKIRAALTPSMKKGDPFKSDSLATAYVGKSQCNSGFLVAALRAEQVFSIDTEHKGMSILSGDLDAWEVQMREADAVVGDDGQPVTVKLRPEPKETRFRKATEPVSEEQPPAEREAVPQDGLPEEVGATPKRLVRVSKKAAIRLGLTDAAAPPEEEAAPPDSVESCDAPEE